MKKLVLNLFFAPSALFCGKSTVAFRIKLGILKNMAPGFQVSGFSLQVFDPTALAHRRVL